MSEPWERNSSKQKASEVDRTAKFLVFAGLTLSLATVIVGTAIKSIKEKIDELRNYNSDSTE